MVCTVYLLLSYLLTSGAAMRATCKRCNDKRVPRQVTTDTGVAYVWKCPTCGSEIYSEIEKYTNPRVMSQSEQTRRERMVEEDISKQVIRHMIRNLVGGMTDYGASPYSFIYR